MDPLDERLERLIPDLGAEQAERGYEEVRAGGAGAGRRRREQHTRVVFETCHGSGTRDVDLESEAPEGQVVGVEAPFHVSVRDERDPRRVRLKPAMAVRADREVRVRVEPPFEAAVRAPRRDDPHAAVGRLLRPQRVGDAATLEEARLLVARVAREGPERTVDQHPLLATVGRIRASQYGR